MKKLNHNNLVKDGEINIFKLYIRLKTLLGKYGVTRIYDRSSQYNYEYKDIKFKLTVSDNSIYIISSSDSKLKITSNQNLDLVIDNIYNYLSNFKFRYRYVFSVNSTNFKYISAVANRCKRLNLNPLDDKFLDKYLESKYNDSFKECIKYARSIYNDSNLNSKEITAIALKLLCTISQGRFRTPLKYIFRGETHSKILDKSSGFRFDTANRHLNLLLRLTGNKRLQTKEFNWKSIGYEGNINFQDIFKSSIPNKIKMTHGNHDRSNVDLRSKLGTAYGIITSYKGNILKHICIDMSTSKLIFIIESNSSKSELDEFTKLIDSTGINYVCSSKMPSKNIVILI